MWCTEYQTGMCENTDKMANGQRKISEQHQQDLVGGGIKQFELKKKFPAPIFSNFVVQKSNQKHTDGITIVSRSYNFYMLRVNESPSDYSLISILYIHTHTHRSTMMR